MHPAQARLHRQILLEDFRGRKALRQDIGRVENQDHAGMVHLLVNLGQDLARAADQVGLDLQAVGQVGAVASLGDLAQLVHGLRQIFPGIGPLGRIERKPADQLGLEARGPIRTPSSPRGRDISETARRRSSSRRRRRSNFTLPMGEPIDETFSPYWSCRWRTFWISASVSFITFLMPPPTSMNRRL